MLKKDDWILTLREAKNQRNMQLIALEVSNAIIDLCNKKSKEFPDENKSKSEKQTY